VPESDYYDNFGDFTRRFVGVEAGCEALPMVALQVVASVQQGKITDIFIASVCFSMCSGVMMVSLALREPCGDIKKLNTGHRSAHRFV
jgi:hypothetical protein